MTPLRWTAAALALFATAAQAELGGTLQTLQSDQLRMKAALPIQRTTSNANYSIHEITTPIGTIVREYANDASVIFAISWRGPVKPDLEQLLGQYFQPFLQGSARNRRGGTSPVAVAEDDLVVYSGGHPRAFMGHAYLKSLIPAGVTTDALQ